ncbi:MAG: c-type cytochrome [Woeseia sp.]
MNNRCSIFGAAIPALLLSLHVSADGLVDGSFEAGKAKAVRCGACHGSDGNSVNPEWPNIAGQHAPYIVRQLEAFQNGERTNILMSSQAMTLTEQDMKDIAVFFAAQPPAAKAVANPRLVTRGQALYRGGNKETGAAACLTCHGPSGRGNPAAAYPLLRGQHATYIAATLREYATGVRKSDGTTRMMRDIAKRLSEDDIVALASYVQGLR